jgi:hypothetical protein
LRVRESRRRRPSEVGVAVSDEGERTRSMRVMGEYLGDVASQIEYVLEPDVEGRGEVLASLENVNVGRFEGLF